MRITLLLVTLILLTGCASGPQELTIEMTGSGSGKVVSNPAGIHCDAKCQDEFELGTTVTLTASPFSRSRFIGWTGGGCSGLGSCAVTLNSDTTVVAEFEISPNTLNGLDTPYLLDSEIRVIQDGFSSDHNIPPMSTVHDGLDIYPKVNHAQFRAVCEGFIKQIYAMDQQVMVYLQCTPSLIFEFNFENQVPGGGITQSGHINFSEGQGVSRGDIIGTLYAPNDLAHVHFSLYQDMVPKCIENYLAPAAYTSMDNFRKLVDSQATICRGPEPVFPKLFTPYVLESDMLHIDKAYSSELASSPWGADNRGFDIYPDGDLKPIQAACDGIVDHVELKQSNVGEYQVEVVIQCDYYVDESAEDAYFIPFAVRYLFETKSADVADGQFQRGKISVSPGNPIGKGDVIGEMKVFSAESHLEFGTSMFAGKEFSSTVDEMPFCPVGHFDATALGSLENLLTRIWPHARLCYQH